MGLWNLVPTIGKRFKKIQSKNVDLVQLRYHQEKTALVKSPVSLVDTLLRET